jgi:hypothetical protein
MCFFRRKPATEPLKPMHSEDFTLLQNQISLVAAGVTLLKADMQGYQLELQQIRDDILKLRRTKHLGGSSHDGSEPPRITQSFNSLNPFA